MVGGGQPVLVSGGTPATCYGPLPTGAMREDSEVMDGKAWTTMVENTSFFSSLNPHFQRHVVGFS